MAALARGLVIAVVLALAACGSQRPAPVVMGSAAQGADGPPPLPAPKPGLAAPGTSVEGVIVAAGDSVYAIARRHGVSMRGLIALNRLEPPYTLQVGQVLRLPREQLHEVVAGDTLSAIAARYGVSMRELARVNGLSDPYIIAVGQRLRIPAGSGAPTGVVATPSEPVVTAIEPEPVETVVISSEGTTSEVPAEPVEVSVVEDPAPPPEPEPEPEPEPAATAVALPTQPAIDASAVPTPAPRAGALFLWPVEGKIVSSFGAKSGGLSNDGINIAASRGDPVVAAENGVVVYAGNEIPGFGNLVLIRHADGWVTAYAHNEALLVKKNDRVERGQRIASVGATGNVASPQSHFEIRRGNDPVDPLEYLADQ